MGRALVLTCEHASPLIPEALRHLFKHDAEILNSHRGWDQGAAAITVAMAERLKCPSVFSGSWSRLLVDLNRSEHHPKLYSPWTRSLPKSEREHIFNVFYLPFRLQVQQAMDSLLKSGFRILHLSIHTFTPVLDGQIRACDLGLLYDPRRDAELQLAKEWERNLGIQTDLKVRRNYPYRGNSDGHVTHLRKRFSENYLGLEIECNQGLLESYTPQVLAQQLLASLPE